MAETSREFLSPAQRSHTDVMGPTTHTPDKALRGPAGSADIHGNTNGFSFRAGNPPPPWLKWYVGQGGITGHQSGTPFATHEPREERAPDDAPPVGWDPEAEAKP